MKRILRIIFVVGVVCVIATALFSSVAVAEPPWCEMICYSFPPETQCACAGDPYLWTTCYFYFQGACEP